MTRYHLVSTGALTCLEIRTESSYSKQTTTNSDTRQLSSKNTSASSQTGDDLSIAVAFLSDFRFVEALAGDRGMRMEYELLGLSLEDVAERHPISYPQFLDDRLSE